MADPTIYETTVPTDGTLALAHEQILRIKRNGNFENITGDINNLDPVPTPITSPREAYGFKGRTSESKLGDNYVITFDVEAVRDDTGAIQAWLIFLLKVAKAKGAANKIEAQHFDALDPALGAIEGKFSVQATKLSTGFADKGGYKFTLTSDGVVRDIDSPIAGTGAPLIASALPLNAVASANVYIRGNNVGAIISATIGGVAVTSISQIPGEPNIVVLEVPAGTVGSAPIIVTNAVGASIAYAYTRGA